MNIELSPILKLYPFYTKVYGPYTRKEDMRKHIVLGNGNKYVNLTISYPKALMEIKLGRRLTKNETVDHIDEDFTNDKIDNLQILTREDNITKSLNKCGIVLCDCGVLFKQNRKEQMYCCSGCPAKNNARLAQLGRGKKLKISKGTSSNLVSGI